MQALHNETMSSTCTIWRVLKLYFVWRHFTYLNTWHISSLITYYYTRKRGRRPAEPVAIYSTGLRLFSLDHLPCCVQGHSLINDVSSGAVPLSTDKKHLLKFSCRLWSTLSTHREQYSCSRRYCSLNLSTKFKLHTTDPPFCWVFVRVSYTGIVFIFKCVLCFYTAAHCLLSFWFSVQHETVCR